MHTTSNNLYQFRLGTTLIRRSHAIWLFLFIASLPFCMLALITLSVAADADSINAAWEGLLVELNEDTNVKFHLIAFAIITLCGIPFILGQRRARIQFWKQGIEIDIPKWLGLGLIGLTTGHWKIRWNDIRKVRLLPNKNAGPVAQRLSGYRLIIETDTAQIKLSPFPWLLRRYHDHRLTWRQVYRANDSDLKKLIEQSPLIRALKQRGIEVTDETELDSHQQNSAATEFDLTQHKGLKTQLILMACLGIYAFIDGLLLGNFKPLESVPLSPFVIIAIASIALAYSLTKGAPKIEGSVVGFLTVAVFIAATYPGLLRINAISAESQQISYIAVDTGIFEPSAGDYPKLILNDLDIYEYWEQYPPGTEHEFTLQRGIAGFYQVDLNPLYAQTRSFYIDK